MTRKRPRDPKLNPHGVLRDPLYCNVIVGHVPRLSYLTSAFMPNDGFFDGCTVVIGRWRAVLWCRERVHNGQPFGAGDAITLKSGGGTRFTGRLAGAPAKRGSRPS